MESWVLFVLETVFLRLKGNQSKVDDGQQARGTHKNREMLQRQRARKEFRSESVQRGRCESSSGRWVEIEIIIRLEGCVEEIECRCVDVCGW